MSGFRERFARFMIGRYGMDRLGQFFKRRSLCFSCGRIVQPE